MLHPDKESFPELDLIDFFLSASLHFLFQSRVRIVEAVGGVLKCVLLLTSEYTLRKPHLSQITNEFAAFKQQWQVNQPTETQGSSKSDENPEDQYFTNKEELVNEVGAQSDWNEVKRSGDKKRKKSDLTPSLSEKYTASLKRRKQTDIISLPPFIKMNNV
ncbi:hypothetical protein ABEB36_004458 [Hypothenemus hampei]|uniref:Uncharacterized protein n=1 Tax=Hypothenemus hampei TaxID=57062 RepID=A0ABD1F6I0_HYPHA